MSSAAVVIGALRVNQSVTFGQSISLFGGLILFACPFGAPNKLFVIFLVLATLSHKNFKLFYYKLDKRDIII